MSPASSVAAARGSVDGQGSGRNTSGVQPDVTAGGLVSLRHVLLRGAVSSATQRDLDRVGGGEEDVRNDGASSRSGSVRQKVGGVKRRAA